MLPTKGLELRFPAVHAAELAATELTPGIESMVREGEFNLGQ